MAIDLRQTAINPDIKEIPPTRNTQADLRAVLKDLQGNILKSHGRDHSRHLFITFRASTKEERDKARKWLAALAVTSAFTQREEARAYRETLATLGENGAFTPAEQRRMIEDASNVFVGVLVSAAGYRDLALGKDAMPDDPAFRDGAEKRTDLLNDPKKDQWEPGFRNTLHALVIAADDDATKRLGPLMEKLRGELKNLALHLHEETGAAMRLDAAGKWNKDAPVREHFGFVDGISQPLFFADDIDRARARQGGIDRYDPSAPLDQVLLKDPGGDRSTGYGSYFVYRKLEQNVPGFRAGEQALAKELAEHDGHQKPAPPTVVAGYTALAGAYMVGRFQDGTPVLERDEAGLGAQPNNFTFDGDVDGVRCPFQAHVRKTNPRGDKQRQFGVPLTQERSNRIVRRGISYGKVTLDPQPADGKVGLLFLCAQSSIADQFEFIQAAWANYQDFLTPHSGLDPVIGTLPQKATPPPTPVAQPWPKKYGSHNQLDFSQNPPAPMSHTFPLAVGQWVTMRGGEYFFVPSLSALKAFGKVTEV
ncbi:MULTISPECIES: Dyp-type peroxidase [unclassified Streptomyces]|uniref:Dyp-type peroxidase n=1 Tax=unclassified Streptomyces TaxID=2593676 RepID=UPI000DDA51A1|nr:MULTISPECIES: Dyp-type peroxidase [unclassified Streptomyces]QZZ26243.1 peroxidase [Streptomyces sp. ST1015]